MGLYVTVAISLVMDAKTLKSKQETPSSSNFCLNTYIMQVPHLLQNLNSLGASSATNVGYVGTLINRDDKVSRTALCPEMLILDLMTTLHCKKPTIITVHEIHTSMATFVDF